MVPHVAATGSASNVPAKRRARVQGKIKGTTAMVAMSMGKYGVRLKEQLQWCGHLAWVCTHVHPVFFPKKIEVNTHNIVYT